jgi:hypothetical protein
MTELANFDVERKRKPSTIRKPAVQRRKRVLIETSRNRWRLCGKNIPPSRQTVPMRKRLRITAGASMP